MSQADRAKHQTTNTAKGPQANNNPVTRNAAADKATANSIAPTRRRLDPLNTPSSYYKQFMVTKQADRQEFYRHYNDTRTAIIDTKNTLSTKATDKTTALDIVNLTAHHD